MQYFPLILLILSLLILLTRIFTVFIHELGHAIPAILLTKEKVIIYIGSYGDPTKSIHLKIGLLVVWVKYNPFSWRRGLCVPTAKNISINKQIIYTITGPLASILIASIALYFTFTFDLHRSIKILLVIFLASAIFDLIVNLIPSTNAIEMYDGRSTYNDGYSLHRLFYFKRLPKEYSKAIELYNQQNYAEAASIFNIMINNGLKETIIFQLAITAYLQVKKYKEAKDLTDLLIMMGKMTADDYSNAGLAYSQLGLHDEALAFYNTSLQINPNHKYSLNNMGYTLNLMNRFAEAIPLFDKAIEIEPAFAYSYNNRGLAKIKLGFTEQGLTDINRSFELDKDNSYGYMNLGIYHFDKGEYTEALTLFNKAKELDSTTYGIDNLISEAERKNK